MFCSILSLIKISYLDVFCILWTGFMVFQSNCTFIVLINNVSFFFDILCFKTFSGVQHLWNPLVGTFQFGFGNICYNQLLFWIKAGYCSLSKCQHSSCLWHCRVSINSAFTASFKLMVPLWYFRTCFNFSNHSTWLHYFCNEECNCSMYIPPCSSANKK